MDTQITTSAYNSMAREYVDNRSSLKSDKYVRRLLKLLEKNSTILDLGCGAGLPVDDLLIKEGHEVIGIDSAKEMIKMARKNCPGGSYFTRDIRELKLGEYQVQAVVSFYTIFHIPRSEHSQLMVKLASYLEKGDYLLITMGDRLFEGYHQLYGQRVWSSQWGVEKNREIVKRAGFEIILDEIDSCGGERHQVILAQKVL